MGVCKCRKRSDLFCFIHRKAICSTCILDHAKCPVGSYLNWLKDSEFEIPKCNVCSTEFTDSAPTVRLTCLHILHPACLEHHASQFPAHTAQAGYGCPQCSKPIVPPDSDQTDLAQALRDVLAAQEWAQAFVGDSKRNSSLSFKPQSGVKSDDLKGHAGNPPDASRGTTVVLNPVSRKSVADDSDDNHDYGAEDADEAEHKYRRRGVMQLLVTLGLLTPGQGGHILNSKRLVLVFLVLSLVMLFWVLFKSASTPTDT